MGKNNYFATKTDVRSLLISCQTPLKLPAFRGSNEMLKRSSRKTEVWKVMYMRNLSRFRAVTSISPLFLYSPPALWT